MSDTLPVGRLEQIVVALVAGLLVGVHAVWGGAYDVVVRAELAIGVWWIVLLGTALGVLPRARLGLASRCCLIGLGLVGVVTTLSLLWTSSAERTVVEVARLAAYLGVLLLLVLLVRRETVRAALLGVLTAVVVVLVAALVVRLAPGSFDDPARDAFGTNRLSAPLNYWNGVAAWGAMATTLLLGVASSPGGRRRGLALTFVPLAVVVTYLTYSRAGILGTGLGLLVLLAIAPRRLALLANVGIGGGAATVAVLVVRGHPAIADGSGAAGGAIVAVAVAGCGLVAGLAAVAGTSRLPVLAGPSRRQRQVGAGLAALVLVALAVTVAPGVVQRGYDSFNRPAPASSASDPTARLAGLGGNRRNLFASAIAAGDTHPWRGIGGGTFELWWNQDARDPEFLRDAHTLYLETWAEYGVLGSLALLAFLAAAAFAGWQAHRSRADGSAAAMAATLVVYAFHAGVDWVWELTGVAVLGLAVLALLGAMASRPAGPVRRRPLARLALVVAALLAIGVQLPPAVSLSNVRKSQSAVRAGDLATARARADDAVAASPWSSTPLVQRALVSERSGDLPAAASDLRLAADRDRQEWRIPLLQARVLAELGRPRAAIRRFEAARRLRPLAAVFRTG